MRNSAYTKLLNLELFINSVALNSLWRLPKDFEIMKNVRIWKFEGDKKFCSKNLLLKLIFLEEISENLWNQQGWGNSSKLLNLLLCNILAFMPNIIFWKGD